MLKTIVKRIRSFLTDEEGPTAVEYAVMLMLIFLFCITTVQVLGLSANDSFVESNNQLDQAFGN